MSARDQTPWLSVLMPIFNGAKMLRKTLLSVVDQAEGIEFILVDQGSTDESAKIAESFADRIDLTIVSAPDNKNWVQNTNKALEIARASRSTMLHQDDIWCSLRAQLLRKMFTDMPDATLWVHGADYIDDAGRRVGALSPPFGSTPRSISANEAVTTLIVQNTIALPAAAFPTELVKEIGGMDESLWYTADWNLWLGLAARGETAWNPKRAAAFRLHRGSLTILGSQNLNDFEAQLAVPIERYRHAVPKAQADLVIRQGEFSNRLNLWLASFFHGSRKPFLPILHGFLSLGPRSWASFFTQSQIIARTLPRLKLKFGRKPAS